MKKPILLLAPVAWILALGVAAADAPPAGVQLPVTDAAVTAEPAPPVPPIGAAPGTEGVTPHWAAKPPQQTCPGQFDISRLASFQECTLAACNQWCIESGASYSAYEVWIAWGFCGCRCCP